jgi:hypothetical protein
MPSTRPATTLSVSRPPSSGTDASAAHTGIVKAMMDARPAGTIVSP